MKTRSGFSLVELLVAMAILGTVLALAYGTITAGARHQREHEARTSAQAKLRRVHEVIAQDVRSAVFGNISNSPYASSQNAVSFTLMAGGAGYQVLPQNTTGTLTTGAVSTVGRTANTAPDLANTQVLLVNGDGRAVIFNVTNVTKNASGYWDFHFPSSCGTFTYTANTLAFRVFTLGYRHNTANQTLMFRSGTQAEQPLAFDITRFVLTYVYVNRATGALQERTTPFVVNNVPQKVMTVTTGGTTTNWTLSQIRVVLTGVETAQGRRIERTYQNAIDLGAAQTLNVREVRAC